MFEMQVVMLNQFINTTIGTTHLLVVLGVVVTCLLEGACKAAYLPEGTCKAGVFQCFKSEKAGVFQ
jgi:hypothetical protein